MTKLPFLCYPFRGGNMSNTNDLNEKKEGKETSEKLRKYETPQLKITAQEKKELEDFFKLSGEAYEKRKKELEKKYKPKVDKYKKELEQELARAPKNSCFKDFDKSIEKGNTLDYLEKKYKEKKEQKEDKSILDEREVKILVGRILAAHPRLRLFFEKYCVLKYNAHGKKDDPADKGGATITRDGEKFQIEVDHDSFMTELSTTDKKTGITHTLRYLDTSKFSFILVQALSQLIPQPGKLASLWAKKKAEDKEASIDKNSPTDWSEFFTLCIMDPEQAQKIDSNAYAEFEKFINEFDIKPRLIGDKIDIKIKNPEINYDYIYKEYPKKERKSAWLNGILKSLNIGFISNVVGLFTGETKLVWREGIDWDERARAEFDLKEVGRIIARDEGIVERDKRLKELIKWKDKENCRRLIQADSQTGDFDQIRLLLYAETFDPLFKKTHGREISQETFNLFQRCRRISEKVRRVGTKPMDYEHDPKTNRYVKIDSKRYQKMVNAEWGKKSDRDSQNTLQETYEHMKSGKTGDFVDLDSHWGDNLEDPESEGWYTSTGDWREILGREEAKKFFTTLRSYAEEMGDLDWLSKVRPDQIGAIARFHITANRGGPGAPAGSATAIERNLGHEHTKPITREAWLFYGDEIPALKEKQEIQAEETLQEIAAGSPEDFLREKSSEEIQHVYNNLRPTKVKMQPTAVDIVSKNFENLNRKLRNAKLPEEVKLLLEMKFAFLKKETEKEEPEEAINEEPEEAINIQVDDFKKELDRVLLNYSDQQLQTYKFLDDFLAELKNCGIINAYKKAFKPYQDAIDELKEEKGPDKKTKTEIKEKYEELKENEPEQVINDLNKAFKGKGFEIDEKEKTAILAAAEPSLKLSIIVYEKLDKKTLFLPDVLEDEKKEISTLYEKILSEKETFSELKEEFKNIKAVSKKNLGAIEDVSDLRKSLEISYMILLDKINSSEKPKDENSKNKKPTDES